MLVILIVAAAGTMAGIWWLENGVLQVNVSREIADPPPPVPELTAWGAVLMDQDDGEIIYSKNALQPVYPASTTKVLTALLALETCSPDEMVAVGPEVNMIPANGSRAGLKPGCKLSLRSLLYCLLLPSGNDAAYTIAVHVGRLKTGRPDLPVDQSLLIFQAMMNQRARQIGALNSHFVNPDGYQNIEHYSTPYDMALIAREAMKNPVFCQVVGTSRYILTDVPGYRLALKNTNELLFPDSPHYFAGATGIKTGHTTPAGACLISSASLPNARLIAVIMHSNDKDLYSDSRLLLNYGAKN